MPIKVRHRLAAGLTFTIATMAPSRLAADESLAQLLLSRDEDRRFRGYQVAEARAALEAEEIRALIQSLRYRDDLVVEKDTPYGPSTQETRATRILSRHGQRALPFLVEALDDADWNVRRHAAVALGATCNSDAIPPLAKALGKEIDRAEHSSIELPDGRRRRPLSVLFALIRAQARLDPEGAFNRCLDLFVEGRREFRNLVANQLLTQIVRTPAMNCDLGTESDWQSRRSAWTDCWQKNRRRSLAEGFSVEVCPP